ncbi:putative lipopolysaccharide heptosyltransferase III [Campylobacter pinnipediorum subsp. caledonicus]|uniref:putative lipopolysaccharide heptosyltransferase III n=1 Tax=Campylobacter pinnipediorum TaxID=1965231 RepID=UPI0009957D59|nr:putative lipopolysaccharide heptosyltransferase III [Campylobacter pinnipediorum]OPA71622.1 putative lipopolysaccharide heptosyltransferase III [Campylobacter pinnipediorum subsp. caledonicus]
MKILVMKFRNIGDVLLTTPLISNLRHHFPNSQIDFALNKGCEAMINQNPNINQVHIYDREFARSGGIFRRIKTELKFISKIKKQKYDIAIQTTSGDRGIIIAKYAKIKKIVGFEGNNKTINKFITHKVDKISGLRHTVDKNLDTLKTLNLEIINKKVKIFFDLNLANSLKLPENFIHFHITSRWMFKCVKDEIIADIIDFCENELNIKCVITSDKNKAELKKVEDVLNICKTNPISFAGLLNLKQVSALSSKSKLFIGVDTAIMHIAAANNIPVIAFFGPSGAFEWGPWDNDLFESGYTKTNGIQTMGKHTVIQQSRDCIPCGKDGCNGSKISDCLTEINDIDTIKNIIINKLQF